MIAAVIAVMAIKPGPAASASQQAIWYACSAGAGLHCLLRIFACGQPGSDHGRGLLVKPGAGAAKNRKNPTALASAMNAPHSAAIAGPATSTRPGAGC